MSCSCTLTVAILVLGAAAGATAQERGGARGGGGGFPGAGAPGAIGQGGVGPVGGGARGFPASTGRRGGGSRIEKVTEAVEQLYRQLNELPLQDVPKRELTVARSAEQVKTKLFRADPKLLENKFVAEFAVAPVGLNVKDVAQADEQAQVIGRRLNLDDDLRRALPAELSRLLNWEGAWMFHPRSGGFRDAVPLQEHFSNLKENCPPDAGSEFLTSSDVNRDVRRRVFENGLPAWKFTVYGPTADEAEARCRAIIELLDCGLSRPLQKYLLTQGREALLKARQAEADVTTAATAERIESDKLAKPSEISPDILAQLKAQKIMVAVELAGLIARVKACDEMLKDPKKLELSTLQSISDMKVKAEIERVGIKEKLDQINVFIGEGDGREAATARQTEAALAKSRAQSLLSLYNTQAESFGQLVLLYAPLQIEGNQIKISPIEWTN